MTTTAVLLLAGLVALAWVPRRAAPRATGTRRVAVRWRSWSRRRGRRRRTPDLAVVVTEVASRLRAGAPPTAAWASTVERVLGPGTTANDDGRWNEEAGGRPGVAPLADEDTRSPWEQLGPADGLAPGLARLVGHCAGDDRTSVAVRTVVVASRLTHTLGAPLAEVLDRCAATVTEAETASDARRVALAGPRSTARILSGLPLLGLLLGAGLGADPLAVATDGAWGSASVLLGLVLLAVGQRWTHALVAAAEGAPGEGRRRRRRGRASR